MSPNQLGVLRMAVLSVMARSNGVVGLEGKLRSRLPSLAGSRSPFSLLHVFLLQPFYRSIAQSIDKSTSPDWQYHARLSSENVAQCMEASMHDKDATTVPRPECTRPTKSARTNLPTLDKPGRAMPTCTHTTSGARNSRDPNSHARRQPDSGELAWSI